QQTRPADVAWVEQQHTKHQQLPTNKLILVSLSGFTEQAQDLATKLGIDYYTPKQAGVLDWTKVVGRSGLFIARYDFTPIAHWLTLTTPSGRSERIEAGRDTFLRTEHPEET